MKGFLLAFVPILIAVDPLGILPIFLGLAEGLDARSRRRAILESVITASVLAVGFVFLGKSLFRLLGVSVDDFFVAGGTLLFLIATLDLVSGRKLAREGGAIGVVPLGTPLIVGPAVLTTTLMLVEIHGIAATLAAVVANVLLAGGLFLCAGALTRVLGQTGIRAGSKVVSLILAAIGVMMIRKGIVGIVAAAACAGGP
ncbi:MAG TPA: MarC family protein [Phycisphaerae bacterium]|nr:MarC family protein [Phycisphaerae bacterium]